MALLGEYLALLDGGELSAEDIRAACEDGGVTVRAAAGPDELAAVLRDYLHTALGDIAESPEELALNAVMEPGAEGGSDRAVFTSPPTATAGVGATGMVAQSLSDGGVTDSDLAAMQEYLDLLDEYDDISTEDLFAACKDEGLVTFSGASRHELAAVLRSHLQEQFDSIILQKQQQQQQQWEHGQQQRALVGLVTEPGAQEVSRVEPAASAPAPALAPAPAPAPAPAGTPPARPTTPAMETTPAELDSLREPEPEQAEVGLVTEPGATEVARAEPATPEPAPKPSKNPGPENGPVPEKHVVLHQEPQPEKKTGLATESQLATEETLESRLLKSLSKSIAPIAAIAPEPENAAPVATLATPEPAADPAAANLLSVPAKDESESRPVQEPDEVHPVTEVQSEPEAQPVPQKTLEPKHEPEPEPELVPVAPVVPVKVRALLIGRCIRALLCARVRHAISPWACCTGGTAHVEAGHR
jgi:hypothetical protein